eukprot:g1324.t1
MNKRHERKRRQRDAELMKSLEFLRKDCAPRLDYVQSDEEEERIKEKVQWDAEDFPSVLDPMNVLVTKMTKVGRGKRKRQQLESMIEHLKDIVKPGDTIVDFGCGQGHLGLLVAFVFPTCRVVLIDNNPHKLKMIREKMEKLEKSSSYCAVSMKDRVSTYLDMDAVSCISFDVGVGLHCCGPLTDAVIDRCVDMGASICISPCCYGKIAPTVANMCTKVSSNADRVNAWKSVARGADFNPGPAHSFDPRSWMFRRAKQCMNWIDGSLRATRLRERGYERIVVKNMLPLTCSPKNNILCAIPKSRRGTLPPSALRDDGEIKERKSVPGSFVDKVEYVRSEFTGIVPARVLSPSTMALIASPSPFYRLRARFGVRRHNLSKTQERDEKSLASDDDETRYTHFIYENGKKVDVETSPHASRTISKAMPHFISTLAASTDEMSRGIEAVHYLATLSGDLLITMIYGSRSLDEKMWARNASVFRDALERALRRKRVGLIGRSKGKRVVLDRDFAEETLILRDARILRYDVVEGAFSNPNGRVNERVLDWLCRQVKGFGIGNRGNARLLELYCGCGNHTVAIAPFFESVVAVEIDRKLCETANRNLARNGCSDVAHVFRIDSEKFWTKDFQAPPKFGSFDAVLVDPPRAGLDRKTLRACASFEHVLYISCKPASLKRDLTELTKSHEVVSMGVFDHFASTRHIECGCLLRRRRPRRYPALLLWGAICAFAAIRSWGA